jgi:predicted  nucleic acid-binding Zn-ribbon protein
LRLLYTEEAERLQSNVDFWQEKVNSLIKELKQSNEAQSSMNKKISEMQAENSRTVTHLRKTIQD